MPYRYKESGLDDVVLRRGYATRQTPYGETVAIHDVEGVHRKIAAKLVKQPYLTGAELRFLRLEMDQTQAELAKTLGTSEQTLSLWERDRKKPIPETAAKLLQVIADVHFLMKRMKRGDIDKAITRGLRLGTVAVLRPRDFGPRAAGKGAVHHKRAAKAGKKRVPAAAKKRQ
jgi:putative transcriptional regulator